MTISPDQMNELMNKISANIPTDCAAYEDIQKKSNEKTPLWGSTEFNISDYEAYRNDIEFVNSFADQVILDESKYFVNKYSQKVYDYLLQQRVSYTSKMRTQQVTALCGSSTSTTGSNTLANCPNVCNSVEQIEKNKECADSQTFLSYLTNQLSSSAIRPETTYKKIEYRNEAHELLDSINYWMTVLYFILLLVMLILLLTSNRLNLRSRFPLYLFLLVLPIIFPYLFEGLKYIYKYLFTEINTPTRGPQDAFIESL